MLEVMFVLGPVQLLVACNAALLSRLDWRLEVWEGAGREAGGQRCCLGQRVSSAADWGCVASLAAGELDLRRRR